MKRPSPISKAKLAQAVTTIMRHLRAAAYVNKIVITAGMISNATEAQGAKGSDGSEDLKGWVAELADAAGTLSRRIRETRIRH